MHIVRAFVVSAILLSAVPAFAQESNPPRRDRRETPQVQVRAFALSYSGLYGRFFFGRSGIGLPVARPRMAWIADNFVEEGRPLGLSPNAYASWPFARPGWSGWPYYANQDLAPKAPATPKAESASAILEGRNRWKAGDFTGALAGFKESVANDLESGAARLHMALGLLAMGDLRNADKALVSALDIVRTPEELNALGFPEWFRNAKERAKFEDRLIPARDGSGSLSIALAQHLLGLKAKAAKTLEGAKEGSDRLGGLLR
jgi:hypothetical protein